MTNSDQANEPLHPRARAILEFWFGRVPDHRHTLGDTFRTIKCVPYWHGHYYSRVMNVDGRMRDLFSADLAEVGKGLKVLEESITGRLALILLCDQFTRNIYRGTVGAFGHDGYVYDLALRCLYAGEDKLFHPLVRSFYYLPLVHVEDIHVQNRAVDLYRKALKQTIAPLPKILLAMDLAGTKRHRDIIQMFGRFPHRNTILGRDTTSEEAAFLKQPFSKF